MSVVWESSVSVCGERELCMCVSGVRELCISVL